MLCCYETGTSIFGMVVGTNQFQTGNATFGRAIELKQFDEQPGLGLGTNW
jgi:hypothetical protein